MTKVSRRNFLKFAIMGAVATGCSPIIDNRLQANVSLSSTIDTAPNNIVHFLNRATFGATPQLVQAVQSQGLDTWLDAQLSYQSIENWQTDLRLRRFNTLSMTSGDLLSFVRLPDKRMVANELASAMLVRAIYSERQLYEKMVHFWTDHFSIYYFKDRTANLQTVDDREVIRPHALGNFGDMLRASAHSPAMLVYLDNVVNEKSHPNENYAREIMELHTLGVDGAYTEDDVQEVARCFTGWSVTDNGQFAYVSEWHDEGEKFVLGHVIPANGGQADGDRVLDILINHPDTARYVTTKLLRRFVADDPSQAMINDISQVWTNSEGDISTIMRAIFEHDAFWTAPPKYKRPLEYAISVLRSVQATYDGSKQLVERLRIMGQRPFGFNTPDGYPDTADEWVGSLVPRWNFAQDIVAGYQAGVSINNRNWLRLAQAQGQQAIANAILLRDMSENELQAVHSVIADANNLNQNDVHSILGILLSSPSFQWR
ncbi:MAG: hypothetical protein Phog2KO_14600 [Phototrophicaceae bacterium]